MLKAKPISKGAKPGKEGLPYKSFESVTGGPDEEMQKPGLNPSHEVKGSKSVKYHK